MPHGVRILLSWILAVDGAVLAGLGCYLSFAYHVAAKTGTLPHHIHRQHEQTSALKLSHALLLLLVVVVAIWDMANPGQQFPVAIRLALTLPALALSNYGLVGLVAEASSHLREYQHRFRG